MPDVSDRSERLELGEFCEQLRRLRLECGDPPLKSFEHDAPVRRTQLSALFLGKISKPPSWDLVRAIVGVCRLTATKGGLTPSFPLADNYWQDRLQCVIRTFARPAPDAWADLAGKHPAWQYAEDADTLRSEVGALAQRLADRRAAAARRLVDDPWLDRGLPERVLAYAEDLLQRCNAESALRLSSTEAALVVLVPMLHYVVSLETAAKFADVEPANLRQTAASPGSPRSGYERFLTSNPHQRLVSRALLPHIEGRESQPDEIGWWLYHRWLADRAPRVDANPVEGLIADGRLHRVLAGPLVHLIRLFGLPPSDLQNPARDHLGSVRGSLVRERFIGLLLVTAHAMAIELATLSSVIVEHLGIPEPVKIDDLRQTLENCDWTVESSGIVLNACCRHEAVLEALAGHCDHTDEVLRAVRSVAARETAVQALRALPAGASSGEVRPEEIGGRPLFVVPPARFTLDETRVRELLMGEQLYRDRSLAIRELYQNALDACRYRKARHEYRRRIGQPDGDWRGQIEFEQGVDDDGRPYLLCRDNGVGMDRTELSEVFSRAGVRFADRLEFSEERAEWAEVDVFLHPNSRFGIGVMSYFMLADEIEVTTCRMSREHRLPGPELKVFIAGPGHLFRINEVVPHGDEPGTSVKLFLRPDEDVPSCVRTLRALLGIAEFETVAAHDGSVAEWHPDEFKARERQDWEDSGINAYGQLAAAPPRPDGQVVWCQFGGALLVDGIYVHAAHQRKLLHAVDGALDPRGAVVNIVGARAPALTVDRMSVFQDVSDIAEELLRDAAEVLCADGSAFASYRWIIAVAQTSPGIADLVTETLSAAGSELMLSDRTLRIGAAGAMAIDSELCGARDLSGREAGKKIRRWRIPDHILLWRLLALVDDPLGSLSGLAAGPVLPAKPSDALILANMTDDESYGKPRSEPPLGPFFKSCADLGVDEEAVSKRMQLLNLPRPRLIAESHARHSPFDLALLSESADGRPPWLPVGPVDVSHLVVASVRLKMPMTRVADRLRELGYAIPDAVDLPRRVEDSDLRLLSYSIDGKRPWISVKYGISFQRLVQFAIASHQTVDQALARARELGLSVRDCRKTSVSIFALDSRIAQLAMELQRNLDAGVSRAELVYRAARQGLPPRKTARKLIMAGFDIKEVDEIPEVLEVNDAAILKKINLYQIFASKALLIDISLKTGISYGEVSTRLRDLGFNVVLGSEFEATLDSTDQMLVSRVKDLLSESGVSLHAAISAAVSAECSPREAGARLQRIGIPVSNYGGLPVADSELDVKAISRNILYSRLVPRGAPVPLAHLIRVAYQNDLSPRDVARRLEALGYRTPPEDEVSSYADESDVNLLSWQNEITTSWQDPYEPVLIGDLMRAAIRCRISIAAASVRMTQLGCLVPDLEAVLPPLLARVPVVPVL